MIPTVTTASFLWLAALTSTAALLAGTINEDDEAGTNDGQHQAVETKPRPFTLGLGLGQVLDLPNVLHRRQSERQALTELDTTDHAQREELVSELHQAGDTQEEQSGSGEDPRSHDLRYSEIGVGDGHGGNGLHGLDRHRDAVDCAGDGVVDAGEDQCGAQVEVPGQRQGQDDRNVGAEVAHCAVELGPSGPEHQIGPKLVDDLRRYTT